MSSPSCSSNLAWGHQFWPLTWSYIILSCCCMSRIRKLSLKASVRGADCGVCEHPAPGPETAIAEQNPPPWPPYSKLSEALAQGTTCHRLASGLQGGLLPGWDPDRSGGGRWAGKQQR